MIQEAVVVMTILGCGDQVQSCDLVLSPEKTWESHSECRAAIPLHLHSLQNSPYPVLTASCEVIKKSGNPVIVQSVEESRLAAAFEADVINEQTMFDKLRAKADAMDLDIIAKIRSGLASLADIPR